MHIALIKMNCAWDQILAAMFRLRGLDADAFGTAIVAGEGHEVETEHVERGESRARCAEEPDAGMKGECAGENLILRIEAGEERNTGDGQRGHEHRPARLRHGL